MDKRNFTNEVLGLLEGIEKSDVADTMLTNIEAGVLARVRPLSQRIIPLRSILSVAASLTLLVMINYYAISSSSAGSSSLSESSESAAYDLLAIQTLYDE